MNANVDVLAVMDKAIDSVNMRLSPEHAEWNAELRDARDAVAALIDALRATTAAIGYLNRAYPPGEIAGAWQRNDAFDKAKAVLDRIGGAE